MASVDVGSLLMGVAVVLNAAPQATTMRINSTMSMPNLGPLAAVDMSLEGVPDAPTSGRGNADGEYARHAKAAEKIAGRLFAALASPAAQRRLVPVAVAAQVV